MNLRRVSVKDKPATAFTIGRKQNVLWHLEVWQLIPGQDHNNNLVSRASIGGSDLSATLKDLIEEMTAMQTALESRWLNSPSQFKEWLMLQETIQETREVLVVETIRDHLHAIIHWERSPTSRKQVAEDYQR